MLHTGQLTPSYPSFSAFPPSQFCLFTFDQRWSTYRRGVSLAGQPLATPTSRVRVWPARLKRSVKPDCNLSGLVPRCQALSNFSQAPYDLGTSLRNNIRTQQQWCQQRERQWQRVYWRRPTPSVRNDRDRDTLLTIHSLRVHLVFGAKMWLPRFRPIKFEQEWYRRAPCQPASASIKSESSSAEAIRARF